MDIGRLLSKYKNIQATKKDVLQALDQYRALTLSLDGYVFNDGSKKELVKLVGTIPIIYKKNVYHIPISIWLMETHPYDTPICFVKPTADMHIKVSMYVDHNGKIYLPYLHDWQPESSDVVSLIQVMIVTFGEHVPVYSKPKDAPYPRQQTSFMLQSGGVTNPPSSGPSSTPKQDKDSSCDNSAEGVLTACNEFRRLGLYTDFVIIVGSKEFPVNKIILASQSSIFAEMFKVMTNGRFVSKLDISDVSQQAVEAFLDYLYERKHPDDEHVSEIFKLAAKYEVAKLKDKCEQIIRENLDESNAFEVFKLACGPHKSEELKAAAFGILQQTFGNDLGDNLINNPENLLLIVETKKRLDDLVKKSKNNEG